MVRFAGRGWHEVQLHWVCRRIKRSGKGRRQVRINRFDDIMLEAVQKCQIGWCSIHCWVNKGLVHDELALSGWEPCGTRPE